jgi:serine/threonine protein kinase
MAKIIDLGLAKVVNEAGSQTTISTPGGFAGTPEFASPEQFAGLGVDIRSGLYSLGVMLWEMLTGHGLFEGSPAEVMFQHQHARLPESRGKERRTEPTIFSRQPYSVFAGRICSPVWETSDLGIPPTLQGHGKSDYSMRADP